MSKPFLAVASSAWLTSHSNQKDLGRGWLPLGRLSPPLNNKCTLFVRYRNAAGALEMDLGSPHAVFKGGHFYIASAALVSEALTARNTYLVVYFEGSRSFARCLALWWSAEDFYGLDSQLSLRMAAYDLPPSATVLVDASHLVQALRNRIAEDDPDLFAIQATRFLDGPHVLERLLDHLMELRAIEAPNFISVTKGLSDQVRDLLTKEKSPVQLRVITHSHLDLWASVQGQPIVFIDGGVARLSGYPGIDQFAMRVGTYRVIPGNADPDSREDWSMYSRVLADVVDPNQYGDDQPDRKRLQEAIRYTLEALVLLRSLNDAQPPRYAFLHGPLVNQFVTYDEGEPYFIPNVLPELLGEFGFTKESITSAVKDIPHDRNGAAMWNQFMAVYAAIIKSILESETPAIGVVERSVGRPVTTALFDVLVDRGVVQESFAKEFHALMQKYGISDDLLFGCILKQGEYITPITIRKNPLRRARDRWQPVVKQYGNPRATIVKPQDGTFPLRLELNGKAADHADEAVSVAYHTARLLPQYAFPVGLDIVDKFAKVPDWMTRAVSTAGAAALLRRAVEEADDPSFISAVRRQLAGQPRDFFFRPTVK